jgi:hypothetical protein
MTRDTVIDMREVSCTTGGPVSIFGLLKTYSVTVLAVLRSIFVPMTRSDRDFYTASCGTWPGKPLVEVKDQASRVANRDTVSVCALHVRDHHRTGKTGKR